MEKNKSIYLGDVLKKIRMDNKETQVQVANRGKSIQSFISKIENHLREINTTDLYIIEKCYNIKIKILIEDCKGKIIAESSGEYDNIKE